MRQVTKMPFNYHAAKPKRRKFIAADHSKIKRGRKAIKTVTAPSF
jgi:hypothetical protein